MSFAVTLFGSSVPTEKSLDYATAYACGRMLARAGMTVCNGGYGGTMEASARGAKEAGGATVGVTVSIWPRKPNAWIQREVKTPSLLERLMKLIELGDAYVVLPGGSGTLLEFACVLEMINKGIIVQKPIVLVGDYWEGVLETLRHEPGTEGRNDCTRFVQTAKNPEELTSYLKAVLPSI